MLPTLASSLSLLVAFLLLLPSPGFSQTLWQSPVDFRSSNFWPSEPCVQSCLTGDQCTVCGGHSLSTWVGCTTNDCFCSHYDTAYFLLNDCIMVGCYQDYITTDPYYLIYGYCSSTGAKANAAAAGGGTATVTFTAPPSVTPTGTSVSNPYGAEASEQPPTTTPPAAKDTGLSRSDKIALGVGLGVGIPSTIASIIAILEYCGGW